MRKINMPITKIIICQTCFEKIQPITDKCSYCKNLEILDSDLSDKGVLYFVLFIKKLQ